jgi:MinD superfamily P-loop ATPase
MKQVTIISGKGGTGKTTITASFAALASDVVLADCDVDAADLHLLTAPQIKNTIPFHGLSVASIDETRCTQCGNCVSSCVFDAIIDKIEVVYASCEGCGVCAYICPVQAIQMIPRDSGEIYESITRFGPMVHARLNTAEEASGKLITEVRRRAEEIARFKRMPLILIDGPPGIGCPVISSITGVDLVAIVTEPTYSGIHDLKRVLAVAQHFQIPQAVIINKGDINRGQTKDILSYCKSQEIAILGTISYDERVTQAMIAEKTVIEVGDGNISAELMTCWKNLLSLLESKI